MEVLVKHRNYVYTQIAQEKYTPKPQNKKELFLESLPNQFNRQSYVAVAVKLGITEKLPSAISSSSKMEG